MDAIQIDRNEHGLELRWAGRKSDTWPGWFSPLGKRGYWLGNEREHTYQGRTDPRWRRGFADMYEFEGHLSPYLRAFRAAVQAHVA